MSMKPVPKRVVVAGATGLIGRELVALLLQNDYSVTILSRSRQKVRALFGDKVDYQGWDGVTIAGLVHAVEGCYAVINLSGANISEGLWTKSRKERILQSRISSTQALVKAVHHAKVKPSVFIQGSAIGYYPYQAGTPLTEQSPMGKGFLADVVDSWERAAKPVESYGIRLVFLRTGAVLASNGGMLKALANPVKFFAGAWFGNGNQQVSWIHIADHVRAVLFLLENGAASGPFNLVAEKSVAQKALVKSIAQRLKRPAFMGIPVSLTTLILGDMGRELLLSNQNVKPEKLLQQGFRFLFPQHQDAISNLI